MAVSSDEHNLFLTNFGSNTLEIIDIADQPLSPKPDRRTG